MAPGGVTPTAISRVAGEETATGSGFVKYCPEITIIEQIIFPRIEIFFK